MSVTDVVEQLRQAHALLTEARRATAEADAAITDGAAVFATATLGSAQPEVEQVNHLARASGEEVRAAHALFGQAQDLIDGYCHEIAGHGVGDAGPPVVVSPSADETVRSPSTSSPPPDRVAPEVRYAEQIAELRRNGVKISVERIVRMTRHRDGRIVWLELGDEGSGLGHINRPFRKGNFEDLGTPPHRVPGLIFAGIERGDLIGYTGRDREVYDVEFDGSMRRFSVLFGSNGYIVTSHPMNRDEPGRVRPHLRRK
ncbi:hypothetical protein [Actinoalloteichus sp. GBA129-24]|uniref:hypothetical protein n=1 Tax=Actinoalloteichus sp. GBA129-24 TaxID=1612551 RepID=UPI00095070AE|nr:hypothetical protein [Actinoalloteichus sp. GBA129-24]APU22121.1 hypothetical protein UA75_20660 [Actinoalloteichus sp. GBA129-24]